MLRLGQQRAEPDCFDQTPGNENVRYKHPKTYPLFLQSTSQEAESVEGIGESLHVDHICRGFVGCSVIYNKRKQITQKQATANQQLQNSQILTNFKLVKKGRKKGKSPTESESESASLMLNQKQHQGCPKTSGSLVQLEKSLKRGNVPILQLCGRCGTRGIWSKNLVSERGQRRFFKLRSVLLLIIHAFSVSVRQDKLDWLIP